MTQIPPPPAPPGGQYLRPHRGAVILVLGILSWLVCIICGICAWTMGNEDLRAMDRGEMDPAGRGLTEAGRVLGMIHCIIAIVCLGLVAAYFVAIIIFGILAAIAGSGP